MFVSGNQSYKQVVQLALRVEKLTGERISRGKFQKRNGFRFVLRQSFKKNYLIKKVQKVTAKKRDIPKSLLSDLQDYLKKSQGNKTLWAAFGRQIEEKGEKPLKKIQQP